MGVRILVVAAQFRVLTQIMESCSKLGRELMVSAGGGAGEVTSNKSNLVL